MEDPDIYVNTSDIYKPFWEQCMFISLDDKQRIKITEPGFPVAAAERGKRVIVSMLNDFVVGDYDL